MQKDKDPSAFTIGVVMIGMLLISLLAPYISWEHIGEGLVLLAGRRP